MEGFLEALTTFGHAFCADGNTDFNATGAYLVRDILDGFEA